MAKARNTPGPLTPLELRCISFYLGEADGNQQRAYRLASPNAKATDKTTKENACRLFARSRVKAELQRLQDAAGKIAVAKTAIDKAWVMERLRTVVDDCMADGKLNAAGANRALELIGKEFGMFKDQVEHSGNVKITHEEALKLLG